MLPEILQEWEKRARRPGNLSVMSTRWTEAEADAATQGLKLAIFQFLPPLNQSHRILEIGCGIGRFTQDLGQKAGQTYAIDISPTMLARAQNTIATDHTFLLRQPGHHLSFPEASFDLVFEVTVLPHIVSDPLFRQTLTEMTRVTKPSGSIFICDPLAEGNHSQ
ncbi:MAG: class I SAM-dependent methyltransferase [Candidatus Chisholmbacteria bacterium]|nr:class I SAM-dependent methyltransferase [Candidatus Chisholmbacteria bacterium]